MKENLPVMQLEPIEQPAVQQTGTSWTKALETSAAYRTQQGMLLKGKCEEVLGRKAIADALKGKVQLIFTSPPFPLNRKKKYDNLQGDEYLQWLSKYAVLLSDFLTPTGSIVIELGNAWEPGKPVMSTLALESLLEFRKAANLHLCQQFVCHNPARLPSPAQWVTVKRTRVTDSYTNVWWMSKTTEPKADNKRVLQPYSDSMKQLLKSGKYNAGSRPSEHHVGKTSFLSDNGGSIPSNVLKFSNTAATDAYLSYCRTENLNPHPARMPIGLPTFFVKFLTDENDLVLDPFAGSNTTGAAAEALNRSWIGIEPMDEYIEGSKGRFVNLQTSDLT